MKHNRAFGRLLSACLVVIVLSGCFNSQQRAENNQNSAAEPQQEFDISVTDTQRLSALWEEYLLPAALELDDFEDASTLTPYQTTRVSFKRFLCSNDLQGLMRLEVPENPSYEHYLWPLESAADWVERSFGYHVDNPKQYFSKIVDNNFYGPEYSEEHYAILFKADAGKAWGIYDTFRLDELNPWGFTLGDVSEKPDGTIVAKVNSVRDYQRMTVDNTRTIVLEHEESGDYYFAGVKTEHWNNNLAAMSGSFRQLDCLNDELGYWISNSSMIGVDGDNIFLYFDDTGFMGDNDVRQSKIWKISATSGEVTARLEKELLVDIDNGMRQKVRNTGDGFLLMGKEYVYKYDYNLTLVDTFEVPKAVKDKMEAIYDEEQYRWLTFFAGYDMSADGSMFYYSNQDGLWSYGVAEDAHKLLIPPRIGEGRLMEGAIITPNNIRLVDGDSKIIYIIYGYEGIDSQNCLDLKTMEVSVMPSMYHGGFNGTYYGAGHMIVDTSGGSAVARYFDFASGQRREAPMPVADGADPAKSRYEFDMICPVGEVYGLAGEFVDAGQGMVLYRIRLADMKVEKLDFNIHVSYTPLGVLSDGTAVIYYHVNKAEQGIVLVG